MNYWVFLMLIALVMLMLVRRPHLPHFATAHVINMDKSPDRLMEFQNAARHAGIHVVRWPGVDGALVTAKDLHKLKISILIFRHQESLKKPGVLGCFISHRSLLQHLRDVPCDGNDGHLIFEDDAHIPPNFWDEWEKIGKDLPPDWDIIQFGVTHPNIKPLAGRIHVKSRNRGNVGAFAYAVRHRSLPKICRHLEYMYDPIDNMIADKSDEWKIYIIWPQLCPHNDHGLSTINGNG